MDYRTFLARGGPDWDEAERLLAQFRRGGLASLDLADLERWVGRHRRVVSDYAFARTHFRGTDTERRLRGLAFAGHRVLARREEPLHRRIARFLARDYQETFRDSLPTIRVALALFFGAVVLGTVVTLVRPEFAALFLGAETLEQVQRGELWVDEVTRIVPASVQSSSILTNNISVALFAWGGGALLGLGTLYVLLLNGVMVGSMLAVTWYYGISGKLVTFISAHGPLELFLAVVASAAGLELARGAIVPDSGSRAAGFARGTRRSVRLVLGTVPWFAVLGVVEGYVSPAAGMSPSLKAAVGVTLLLAFLAWALGRRKRAGVIAVRAEATTVSL